AWRRVPGGSPFFLPELVRFAAAGIERPDAREAARPKGPAWGASLDDVIRFRIHALPDGPRRLLELLSVAGQPMRTAVVRQAAELETGDDAVDRLHAAHLVRKRPASDRHAIEPYHDRNPEAVLGRL